MTTAILAEPALVGRERELEELVHLLDSAADGKGKTVFVSGEAGSGKTRLTHEFLNSAKQKRDITLLSGWCFGEAAVPYFPFIEAFNTYFSSLREKDQSDRTESSPNQDKTEAQEQELKQWLANSRQVDRYGQPGALSPEAWKDQAFAAVTNALKSISAQKPTVLFLEDLHWADSASLALVYYISRSIGSNRILVLGTLRSEELTADAEGRSHPLAETLRLLRRENVFTEIKLSSLSEVDVGRVAESMVGGAVLPDFASKLAKESRGNVLFVVESLRMLSERKNLVKEGELWRLSVEELGLPSKFKDVIMQRLGTLKFNQRRILDAASVIGETFDISLLSDVLNQDCLDLLETLHVIAQSTSIVRVEESSFRFEHDKLQKVIYEEVPVPLRKGYHARIAEKLESKSGEARRPYSELAYHYAQAGNTEKAVKNALAAGEDALARWSNAEAINHFTYVLQNISESRQNAAQRSNALEGLGDAYYANSMFRQASETYERLAESETGKAKLRAFRKAMDAVYFGRRDHAHMIELVTRAAPYASSDRLESARVQFYQAGGSSHGGELPKKIKDAQGENSRAALQVFEEEYSLPDVARALEALGSYDSLYNKQEKGLSSLERSISLFREIGDLRGVIRATYFAMINCNSFGLFHEAIEKSKQIIELGQKIGDYDRMARACFIGSKMLEATGRLEEAISVNLEGSQYFDKTDAPLPQERMAASFVTQYAKLGNQAKAEEHFKKLTDLREEHLRSHGGKFLDHHSVDARDLARAKAILFASRNQWMKADECFKEALEIALNEPTYSMFSQLLVRADLVWALNRRGRTEEAKMQLQEIEKLDEAAEKRFAHISIDPSLMAPRNVTADQEFEMRLDLVNISRKTALLVKVEKLLPEKFEVGLLASDSVKIEAGSADLKNEEIGPFQVRTIRIRLNASKPGVFNLNPQVTYVDESGKTQTCTSNPVTVTVRPAPSKYEALPGRITTGYERLDAILLGGIPEKHAVAMTAPSIDETERLVGKFLETGASAGEPTFFVTIEPSKVKTLAEEYHANFFLFVCNPQADAIVESRPNAFRLKGTENLTDIDIALTKAFRALDPIATGPRRFCIDVVSDVLLQHRAVVTRKWLSSLLPTLKLKGFTVLAVINPQMHPPDEVQAILSLFDGEITINEKETPKGMVRFLRIMKLSGQKYLKDEIALAEE